MEFGLQKIVLIDSYVEGRASEIDVSGHTNISGDNGIGKTSFLKLVPIFYGEQPRRLIVESANGNEGFNQFYLPRNGSYLVFEYLSHGQPRMAVFCNQKHASRHRHVFIDSAYREDLFMDVENGQILPAHSLLTRLGAAGIQYLNVDTTQQYRKILLDGTVPKAYHFSMCPRNSRMSKLTPLFTGMFKRDVQFADLSRVIQEYAMDKLDDDARQILENFSIHRDHLTTSLTQYDAYKALEQARPECGEMSDLLDDYTLTNHKLSAVVLAAKGMATDLEIDARSCSEKIEDLIRSRDAEKSDHLDTLSNLDNQKGEVERQRGPVATDIDTLVRDKTSYDRSDMPVWQKKLEGIAQLEGRHGSFKNQLIALEERSDAIRQPIENEITAARNIAQQELDRLSDQFNTLTKEHSANRKRITDKHAGEVREQAAAHQAELTDAQTEAGSINASISALEERLKHPKASEDVLRQFAIAEGARDKAQDRFDAAQDAHNIAARKLTDANERYRQADERYVKARKDCETVEQEYHEVLGLISGEDSTLISFLNDQKPGWQNTLGRVLAPDILRQKNLSPTLSEHDADSTTLCGVQIDFSRLPEQELTPAALQARLEELSQEVQTAEAEEAEAEKALERANTERSRAKAHEETCAGERRSALKELQDARKTLEAIRKAREASELDNKRHTETELQGWYDKRQSMARQLESLTSTHKEASDQLQEMQSAEIEQFDSAHEQAITDIDKSKSAVIATRDQDIRALEEKLNKALAGENIDLSEIEGLRKQVKALGNEIGAIRAKEMTIASYKRFMAEEYSRLPDLKEQLAAFDKDLERIKGEKKAEISRWETRKKELGAQINETEKRKSQSASDANSLKVSIVQSSEDRDLFIREDDETLALYREMKANDLIRDFQALMQKESTLLNDIKKIGGRFAAVFEKYPGTPSTQYWQETVMEWDGTSSQILSRARAILEYFNGGQHDLVRETLVSGFSNLDQIDIYRRAMEGFDKRIRRFNRELAGHVQQNLNFPAIERVEPTVSFELDELDYWKDIKALADGVRSWRENLPLNSLPDDDLVLSLRNYLDTFEESRANVSVNELWRLIRFRFSIIENGKHKTGSSSKDLASSEGLSSNGLSYIVLIVLFLGFIDMQRNGQPVHLSWALDELRAFSNKNKRVLLEMLSEHDISLVTACPDMEDRELGIFHETYMMERTEGGQRFIHWTVPEPGAVAANNPFKDIEYTEATQQGEA